MIGWRKLVLIATISLLCATGASEAADSYTVNSGATSDITEHTVCKRVTNNHASGLSIFVPTKTSPEWASFYGTPPPGVAVAGCPAGCGGFSYGGYCYYKGAFTEACDAACSSRGGCNLAGTQAIGSSGGASIPCADVALALHPGLTQQYGSAAGFSFGCYIATFPNPDVNYRYTDPTTCGAPPPFNSHRICACNN